MNLQIIYHSYKQFQPFTNQEAWFLFRLAAVGEAVGWTLLIGGITVHRFIWPGSQIPVLLAGRIHGTLFLLYIIATLVLAPSLRWSWPKIIVAGLCSVPPYGTLIFEQIMARHLALNEVKNLGNILFYKRVVKAL